jgi:RND family efflux transporter MFP subunit
VVAKAYAALEKAKQKLEDLNQCCYAGDDWLAAQKTLDTAQADYDYCSSYTDDEKLQSQASLDIAAASLKTAEKNYETLKASSGIDSKQLAQAESKVTNAKIAVDDAKTTLAGLTITAPYDGVIITLAAGQGAIVGTNRYITIADISKSMVEVQVDETDMSKLTVGVKAEITFDAIPNKIYTGAVVQAEPTLVTQGQIKTARGLIQLDSSYAKEFQTIPLGLNATVELVLQEATDAVFIPLEGLRTLGTNEYAVFVEGSNGKLRLRTVTVGMKDSTRAQILTGLEQGEIVSTGVVPTSK